jgi:hypothetical protein
MLFSLNVTKKGHIKMWASKSFLLAIRTRLGATVAPGATLRVDGFDFMETKSNHLVGVHDDLSGAEAEAAAIQLCNRILSAYRTLILFEKVFAEQGSFNSYVLFHRSPPKLKELLDLAKMKGIHIPFFELPFKSPLLQEAGPLQPPKPQVNKPLRVISTQGTVRFVPRSNPVPLPRLQELAKTVNSRFGH